MEMSRINFMPNLPILINMSNNRFRPGRAGKFAFAALFFVFTVSFGFGFGFGIDDADIAPWVLRQYRSIDDSPLFPEAFFNSFLDEQRLMENARPFWAATEAETRLLNTRHESLLLNNYILVFYGHPRSRGMGVIGRYPKPVLLDWMNNLGAEYSAIAGGTNVINAFHIIYGTVHPDASIGIIDHDLLREWIEFALENDMLIFIDHQMGRYSPEASLRRMFRWLHYPNVHLALDPEWRTLRPLIEIGHLTADELNHLQDIMEEYLRENNLPGERFFMIHQFNHVMIRNRPDVRNDHRRVRFIHNAAGIGTPQMKRDLWDFTTRATNIPVNGFKLWFDFGFVGHTDIPLMTPQQVFDLRPRPFIVMYQ